MLRPRGRLQVNTGLPRALLLYGGHAGGRGLAQVEGDAGCALRGRAADGAARGWVALGAAQLRLAEEDLHSRQELGHHAAPPDVRGEERDRVQAILRASKGWETAHPGIPGKRKADAIDVEEYG